MEGSEQEARQEIDSGIRQNDLNRPAVVRAEEAEMGKGRGVRLTNGPVPSGIPGSERTPASSRHQKAHENPQGYEDQAAQDWSEGGKVLRCLRRRRHTPPA
jgi:hypothetical protein